ncbi:S-type pyocin domain-containing protein [Photorhabdus asymbiotica]|uniref:S-type pyocin domain-containing protein n=1 Tax=Photorhabdus asymbiotica TaxID=291112 RepID=UPI003DA6CF31
MAIGYFLLVGDKTTCGGQIITGDHTMTFNGRATAREGDKVTCGKHPGTYMIVGGISDMFDMGQRLAGTLDSVSTCPCRARFINSVMDSYEKQEQPRHQAVAPAYMASSPMKDSTTVQTNPPPVTQAPPPPIPVFAKSRQRGKGCTDAGTETEPANNFGRMGIYQVPSSPAPVTESKPEQPPQGKKHPPEPDKPQDKKLPWYKQWLSSSKDKAEVAATAVAATTRSAVADGEALAMRYIGGGVTSAGRWLAAPNPLTVGLMGLFYSPGLNEGEEDYLNRYHLSEIAERFGKAPTRVRFRWIRDEKSGRMTVQGYHVSPESGLDKVPVHMMRLNPTTGNYEFWEPGEKYRPTILWTPNEQKFKVPPHTGNEEQPFIPSQITVLPIPDKVGSDIESLPMPEEKDFRDYILILPIPNMPPVYVYLSKPPVKLLKVDLYSNFAGRPRNGMHADHMPSSAATQAYWKNLYPELKPKQLEKLSKNVAAIIIPADVHRKLSATYGGRNTPEQIRQDANDLRGAVDRDFNTIMPALQEHGATELQLEEARIKMHKLNREQGLYK